MANLGESWRFRRSWRSRSDEQSVLPQFGLAVAESDADPPYPLGMSDIEVRRSTRRRRTVSAYREGTRTIVLLPASMSAAEETEWVARMVARLDRSQKRRRPSDAALLARARRLSDQFLDGRAVPSSVRWVDNQHGRWGSCTPGQGTIRLSRRLETMPKYVLDYVLLHELAHLVVPGHGPRFWAELAEFGPLERARGFLDGFSTAAHLGASDSNPGPPERTGAPG